MGYISEWPKRFLKIFMQVFSQYQVRESDTIMASGLMAEGKSSAFPVYEQNYNEIIHFSG